MTLSFDFDRAIVSIQRTGVSVALALARRRRRTAIGDDGRKLREGA